MHSPSLKNHLLLSAIAAAVLVFDAFVGHSKPGSAQSNLTQNRLQSTNSEMPSARRAATSQPPEATETVSSFAAPAPSPATNRKSPTPEARENLAEQLAAIEQDYKAIAAPVYDQSAPLISPEDRSKLAYLEKEKTEDLSKVLAPAELELYQNTIDPSSAPRRR